MLRSTLDVTETSDPEVTCDAFLGGKIHVLQPRKGFRSGVDAVLLAASVPARPGDTVLELGCGVGVASLCLDARVSGLRLTGVELQSDYAALAQSNATSNGADLSVVKADLQSLPADLRQVQFTHVMMNPPYFDRAAGPAAEDAGRDVALAGDTPLAAWIDIGLKRLSPKGTFTLIQHITRLPEVLSELQGRLGSLIVLPIAGRAISDPNLFLVQGRHSGRAPFQLLKPLVLHGGDTHTRDAESYTAEVKAILRSGAPLRIAD